MSREINFSLFWTLTFDTDDNENSQKVTNMWKSWDNHSLRAIKRIKLIVRPHMWVHNRDSLDLARRSRGQKSRSHSLPSYATCDRSALLYYWHSVDPSLVIERKCFEFLMSAVAVAGNGWLGIRVAKFLLTKFTLKSTLSKKISL
jgi:hypothetical protein